MAWLHEVSMGRGRVSFRVRFACVLVLAALVSWSPRRAIAAEPGAEVDWSGPPARVLADAARLAGNEDAAVVVLLKDALFTFEADGSVTSTYRTVYRIQRRTDVPAKWRGLVAEWRPLESERPRLRSRVISADGQVHELRAEDIGEEIDQDARKKDVDQRWVQARLPGLGVGAVVDEEVSRLERNPLRAANWIFRFAEASAPVLRSRWRVFLPPKELRVHFSSVGLKSAARKDDYSITYEEGPLAATPMDDPAQPAITFTAASSWQQQAEDYVAVVEPLIDARNGAAYAAAIHAAATRDVRQLARRDLAWIHAHVRYREVDFVADGLTPPSPAQTVARGIGDCKAKAVLLAAILRAQHVDAHVVFAAVFRDVHPTLPGIGWFDHMLVVVPGEHPVWIEATTPNGELFPPGRGRPALIIDRATVGLTTTPDR